MVAAQIWRAQVGRVALYLLDTNVAKNSPPDQDITDQLYGGGAEERPEPEVVMGLGRLARIAAAGGPTDQWPLIPVCSAVLPRPLHPPMMARGPRPRSP